MQASAFIMLSDSFVLFKNSEHMKENQLLDVIVIGGSYSGLSAAMSLGRALRKVLVIDAGKPCNRQTPHSHNFITQDGETPAAIAAKAKDQVSKYDTVTYYEDNVINASRVEDGFVVETADGSRWLAKRLVLATGIKDVMPEIPGFASCWGISVLHCPYCHGYEIRHQKTAVLANGEAAFEFGKLIHNWTKDLTILTNGHSTISEEQHTKLLKQGIKVVETPLKQLIHKNGQLEAVILEDGAALAFDAMYARVPFEHSSDIAQQLKCEFTEQGYIKADMMQKTTQQGVYVCGDAASMMRSVANAVATGTFVGATCNKDLIDEQF